MTFQQLLADCYRRLGYETAPDTRVATRIKGFLNDTQQSLAGDPVLAPLLRGTLPLTTVSGQSSYAIPPASSRVRAIVDQTNQYRLTQMSQDWYRLYVPAPALSTGTPTYYVLLGTSAVARQPSAASELFAKSTSGVDTPILHYEVRDSDGVVTTATVTLSGTSAVSFNGALLFLEEIIDAYLDTEAVGTVTIHENSGTGTELARIGAGTTRSTYQTLAFTPTPSAVITYSVDFEHHITDLVTDTDEAAWIPERFHRILASGARVREYEFKDDKTRFTMALAEYQSDLSHLKGYVNSDPDLLVVMGRTPRSVLDEVSWRIT